MIRKHATTLLHSIFFNVVFLLEFVIKVIALGFFWGKGSYLRDAWNKCVPIMTLLHC